MTKIVFEHYDKLGRQIKVGDYVATTRYFELNLGQVIKINRKQVRIKLFDWQNPILKTGDSIVVLEPSKHLTMRILKN